MTHKIAACVWYDGNAEAAATFYAATFPDSSVDAVHRAPMEYPGGSEGAVLTVDFTVCGMKFLGLNGGPVFPQTEAVSFQIFTEDQAETDRLWHAIVDKGGTASACGWCKDRWGVSWQITPRVLTAAMTHPDQAVARRAMAAMMTMGKIDIAAIDRAVAGDS